ncbi:hypothetical protein [Streptomyces sp. NPDC055287]
MPGYAYETAPVPLRRGDPLLLYTDGVVERRGEDITVGGSAPTTGARPTTTPVCSPSSHASSVRSPDCARMYAARRKHACRSRPASVVRRPSAASPWSLSPLADPSRRGASRPGRAPTRVRPAGRAGESSQDRHRPAIQELTVKTSRRRTSRSVRLES